MVGRVFRIVIGFVLACLAAGIAMVLFVYTPGEFAADMSGDRLSEAGILALAAATYTAIFAAPFAVIGACFAEWRSVASWTYYALVGVAIAAIGFLAQLSSEAGGEPTIVNSYALTAFLITGFIGGLVYWLFSGRHAGPAEPPRPADAGEAPAPVQPSSA
jgi:hypothetical protein